MRPMLSNASSKPRNLDDMDAPGRFYTPCSEGGRVGERRLVSRGVAD
jgi:hypothetical protein